MSPITAIFFFSRSGGTLAMLIWSASEIFRTQEDPLGDRLEELQSHAMVATTRVVRRRAGSTTSERFLYIVSLMPGADDWLRGSEKLLRQAGTRRKEALAIFVSLTLFFAG